MDLRYPDEAAKIYKGFGVTSFNGDAALSKTLDTLDLHGKSILDFGCGNGRMEPVFLSRGAAKINAIEPSATMVKNALESLSKLSAADAAKIHFEHVVGPSLPFEDGSFDIIMAHFVFHYIPDLKPAMAELSRVAKKGGLLVATLNNFTFNEGGEHLENSIVPIVIGNKVRVDVFARKRETLVDAISNAGFTIRTSDPFDSSSAHIAKDFPDVDKIIFQNTIIVAEKN